MNELVSIIMPTYNTGKYIKQSIESVKNQTYHNWELIIVDDGSTDNTDEVVNSYEDTRIRYIKNKTNCGAAMARNRALLEAKGKWIAFLDSDDLWKPEKLERQIRFMEENNYSFSYTQYEEMDVDGEFKGVVVSGPEIITKRKMLSYCWPGCLTVMYDARKVGIIQVANLKKNNDYAMWLKVIQKDNCYLLKETLGIYRRGRYGSISTQAFITMIKWHYYLFRKAENKNICESFVYTIINIVFGVYKKIYYVRK